MWLYATFSILVSLQNKFIHFKFEVLDWKYAIDIDGMWLFEIECDSFHSICSSPIDSINVVDAFVRVEVAIYWIGASTFSLDIWDACVKEKTNNICV